MPEAIVGSVSMLALASIPLGFLYYLYKLRSRKMETLLKIMNGGGNIDPETVKLLSSDGGNYKTDYKYAMIWIAIGIPLFFSIALQDGVAEALPALIPVFIGIAYAIAGKFRFRESD